MKDRIVKVKQGLLRGNFGSDPRVKVFRGIPYAEAPVGELRWRPPQEKRPWEGIRDALLYGPIAMQRRNGAKDLWSKEMHPAGTEFQMSEDCLYLNVYTPAKTGNEGLPVLVYIHGGAFTVGYPFEQEVDFEHIASRGIVAVGITFRLGVFGFFAHPDLQKEDPKEAKGNYGLMDIAFALHWIQENIAEFGGNPDEITLAGHSAGASAVQMILYGDAGRYVNRAIIQSSFSMCFADTGSQMHHISEAEEICEKLFYKAGIRNLQEARRMPAEMLMKKTDLLGKGLHFWPVVDGKLLEEDSSLALIHGKWPRIPILAGFSSREAAQELPDGNLPKTAADFLRYSESFQEDRLRFLTTSGVRSVQDIKALFEREAYDKTRMSSIFGAKVASGFGQKVFLYDFDADFPGDYDRIAYHGAELWFAFDALARSQRPFTGEHYDLARIISSYWTNFIVSGDPNGLDQNGDELPEWNAFDEKKPTIMHFEKDAEEEPLMIDELMKFRMEYSLKAFSEWEEKGRTIEYARYNAV
ncbi:MAG: carboxylesterase family protein [Lachnospiraceae bacterium]|nr:carboxylesterase family protein [Lachnospiraceae bacterium]